jgi:hypothetical protein
MTCCWALLAKQDQEQAYFSLVLITTAAPLQRLAVFE